MESKIIKEIPVLLLDLLGGLAGFIISIAWWKASGRTLDSDAVIFIAKIFSGIALFGMILAFIM